MKSRETGTGKNKKYGYIQDFIKKDNRLNVITQHNVLHVQPKFSFSEKPSPAKKDFFLPFFRIRNLKPANYDSISRLNSRERGGKLRMPREGKFEACIPGNQGKREFPLTPAPNTTEPPISGGLLKLVGLPMLPNRNFEAMGAQLVSGVLQILMVLRAQGAQNHEMYLSPPGTPRTHS